MIENVPFFFLFRFLLAKNVAIRRVTPTTAATMSHTTAGCIAAILVSLNSPLAIKLSRESLGSKEATRQPTSGGHDDVPGSHSR